MTPDVESLCGTYRGACVLRGHVVETGAPYMSYLGAQAVTIAATGGRVVMQAPHGTVALEPTATGAVALPAAFSWDLPNGWCLWTLAILGGVVKREGSTLRVTLGYEAHDENGTIRALLTFVGEAAATDTDPGTDWVLDGAAARRGRERTAYLASVADGGEGAAPGAVPSIEARIFACDVLGAVAADDRGGGRVRVEPCPQSLSMDLPGGRVLEVVRDDSGRTVSSVMMGGRPLHVTRSGEA